MHFNHCKISDSVSFAAEAKLTGAVT